MASTNYLTVKSHLTEIKNYADRDTLSEVSNIFFLLRRFNLIHVENILLSSDVCNNVYVCFNDRIMAQITFLCLKYRYFLLEFKLNIYIYFFIYPYIEELQKNYASKSIKK